jgi:hypothetical protein
MQMENQTDVAVMAWASQRSPRQAAPSQTPNPSNKEKRAACSARMPGKGVHFFLDGLPAPQQAPMQTAVVTTGHRLASFLFLLGFHQVL